MADFLMGLPLFSIALTFAAFQAGAWIQKKTKSPLFNPILIGAALVIGVLLLTNIDPGDYVAATDSITWLLTPATVCLAVPLYRQIKVVKKSLPAILIGIFTGVITSLLTVFLLCMLFRLDRHLSVSLMPKSITTAIGLALSEQNGGNPTLTSIVIVVTGVFGNLIGPSLCKIFKLTDPISQGVAFGASAHLGGTSKATEMDPLAGAVSSLSLVASGVISSVIFPIFMALL